jgi:7-cyano-7-deazaguanine reductase
MATVGDFSLVRFARPSYHRGMPKPDLLEFFPSPTDQPFVIEHVNEEFTSLCPKTGHPDFGRIIVRYQPGKSCVELKSLKLYFQSFRTEGIFYEAVTNRIRDDLAKAMSPKWLQVVTEWKGRGGIHSRIIATSGSVPSEWMRGSCMLA